MSKTQRRWSPQEDLILQKEVEAQIAINHGTVEDWSLIAQKIEGRSNKDCRKRYYNGISEGLKKGPWSTEEDQLLKRLVSKHGPTWAVITREIVTRSADQCSKRWQHCLDPELDRSCWSIEENLMLINAVKTHESAWKDIQRLHFPSRSANNVKNQHSALRRQNLEVPPDTPSCCAAQVEKLRDVASSEVDTSLMLNDRSELLSSSDIDINSAFDEMTDTHYQNHEFYEPKSFPDLESEASFHRVAAEMQSHAMPPDSMNYGFNPMDPREQSTISVATGQPSLNHATSANLHQEAFDLHMQDTIPTPLSYSSTHPNRSSDSFLDRPVDTSQNILEGSHSINNTFEWPIFDLEALEHQQPSPSSGNTNIPSSPVTPDLQTTIRLEGADPSTVSAVIGVLIRSKAKFKLETH